MGDSIDQVIQRERQMESYSNYQSASSPMPRSPGRERTARTTRSDASTRELDPANVGKAYGRRPSTSTNGRYSSMTGESTGRYDRTGGGFADIGDKAGFTDFFHADVFQIVLRNPTTAHRFLRFCQSRACGENIEFLEKVRPNLLPLAFQHVVSNGIAQMPSGNSVACSAVFTGLNGINLQYILVFGDLH